MAGRDVGTLRRHFAPVRISRPVNAAFQRRRRFVHRPLRHGHQSNQVGQIGDAARQPARFLEPGAVFVKRAVRQPGLGQGRGQIVGPRDLLGVAERDGRFHRPGFPRNDRPQSGVGVPLRVGVRLVLRLYYNGRTTGRGDQRIGMPPRMVNDSLRLFGARTAQPGSIGRNRSASATLVALSI